MWIDGLKDVFDIVKKVSDSVKKFNETDVDFLQSKSTQVFIQYLEDKYPKEISELWCSVKDYIGEAHKSLLQNKVKKWVEFFEDITWIISKTKTETTQLKEKIINNEHVWTIQTVFQIASWEQSAIKNTINTFVWLSTESEKEQFLQSLWLSLTPQDISTQPIVKKEEIITPSVEQPIAVIAPNIKERGNKEVGDYTSIVESVIKHIEWWYYHPDMNITRMGKSWETMMGIDRRHWWDLNTSDAWKKFRAIIDQDKKANSELRKHNYKWWTKEQQLVTLAGQIIKPHYENLCSKYLSKESLELINNDKRLLFNFIYCAWNGEWRFKKFANKINGEVKKWTYNTDSLYKEIMNYRKNWTGNSLIAQWGKKIEKILDQWLV